MNRLAGKAAKILALTLITMLFLAITAFAADGDPLVVGIGKTTGSSLRLRAAPSGAVSFKHLTLPTQSSV